jgi:hypothetical protein
MQSKIKNPMSSPDWRENFPKQNAERELDIKKLEEAKK